MPTLQDLLYKRVTKSLDNIYQQLDQELEKRIGQEFPSKEDLRTFAKSLIRVQKGDYMEWWQETETSCNLLFDSLPKPVIEQKVTEDGIYITTAKW